MKCTNEKQMRRVAHAGAMKMPGSGYTYEKIAGTEYYVRKENGDLYLVDTEAGFCSCPFHEENRHIPGTICKHLLWLSWMLEAEEVRWERQLAREIVQNGGGLGINEVTGDSRLAKMFAHQFDEIEARLI